jgi:hypothetical protein
VEFLAVCRDTKDARGKTNSRFDCFPTKITHIREREREREREEEEEENTNPNRKPNQFGVTSNRKLKKLPKPCENEHRNWKGKFSEIE